MEHAETPSLIEGEVLWDVVDEHLDEAEFALESWRRALHSPLYTLDELARGPEARLFAHVDALLIHGKSVAGRLLVPELEAPDDPVFERSVAAALVLLAAGRWDIVWRALSSEVAVVRAAAAEGLVLAGPPEVDKAIASQLDPGCVGPPPGLRATLLELAFRRGLDLPDLLGALGSIEPGEAAAAAMAARVGDPARYLPALEPLLDHPDPCARDAALITGLCLGSTPTWRHCLALAANPARPEPLAMLLVALLGGPEQHAILTGHLTRKTHCTAALAALAWTGQAAVVPTLLPWLASGNPAVARLASFAFANLTGVSTSERPYASRERAQEEDALPDLEDDDLDADLLPCPEDDLPLPDVEAIEAHWKRHGGKLDARQRILAGVPWTLAACFDQMEHASLYVRRRLGLWLLVRSGGAARITGRAWSSALRDQVIRARSLTPRALTRWFGGW